ncbi:MAG: glycosyltransferase, partial [Anaerolineales bacterium]|nr:glycosyltransferase [Anaerolineales bacterium]
DERLAAFLEKVLARDVAADRRTLPGILCSSRLDPKKNHIGLVRAFGGSVALQEAANLLIVVRGIEDIHSREGLTPTEVEVLDEIERIVQTEDLWGKVSVFSLESQMDLAGAYRYMAERRSVFTLTALFEPFGLAPLEAMACGLPVIVTKNGGPSESMREGNREFGVLVDPLDPGDIAKGILRLVGSNNEWGYFHKRGKRRVFDRYTWEKTASGYLAVLMNLMSLDTHKMIIPKYFMDPHPENEILLESFTSTWR